MVSVMSENGRESMAHILGRLGVASHARNAISHVHASTLVQQCGAIAVGHRTELFRARESAANQKGRSGRDGISTERREISAAAGSGDDADRRSAGLAPLSETGNSPFPLQRTIITKGEIS
ncbi:MAG TPA: hypothetical protein VIR56_08235 [Solimonas sp.]